MNEIIIAGTLGEFLNLYPLECSVEVQNECYETLIEWAYSNMMKLQNVLNEDLLGRRVLDLDAINNKLIIRIEGMEDAE